MKVKGQNYKWTQSIFVCVFALSTASQDSGAFFLTKSGSVGSRGGTTTWASPTTEAATSAHQSPTLCCSSFELCTNPSNQNPTPPLRAPNSGQIKNPTQRPNSDQDLLEPILEAPPDSPIASLNISSPYKRKLKVQMEDLLSKLATGTNKDLSCCCSALCAALTRFLECLDREVQKKLKEFALSLWI